MILLILEATRRTVGWILPAITVIFLIYCYLGPYVPEPFDHRGFNINRIIGQNYLTLEGIFSTPMDVAATFIILFTVYGAVLERGGRWKVVSAGWDHALHAPLRLTVAGTTTITAASRPSLRWRARRGAS